MLAVQPGVGHLASLILLFLIYEARMITIASEGD